MNLGDKIEITECMNGVDVHFEIGQVIEATKTNIAELTRFVELGRAIIQPFPGKANEVVNLLPNDRPTITKYTRKRIAPKDGPVLGSDVDKGQSPRGTPAGEEQAEHPV